MKDRVAAVHLPLYGCAIVVNCLIASSGGAPSDRLFHLVSEMGGGAGILAGGAAGILLGGISAFLGAVATAGLRSLVTGPRRSVRGAVAPAKGTGVTARRRRRELVLMGSLATVSGLAAVSCGGAGRTSAVGGGVDGTVSIVITLGVVAGGAIGILAGFRLAPCLGAIWRSFDSRLLSSGMTLLPEHARERWSEEWRGELAQIPSPWLRLRFCVSLLLGMPRMAWTLRSALPRRRDG